MANEKLNYGIIKQMTEEGPISFFPKTMGFLVELNNGENVEAAIAEILAAIATKATPSDITAAVSALVGGAPNAFDTLKEIADWIEEHGDAASDLVTQLADKVEKEDGKGLSSEDFTSELKAKLESLTQYTHPETHLADMILETEEKKFMTVAEKAKLEAINGVACGSTPAAETNLPVGTMYFEITGNISIDDE